MTIQEYIEIVSKRLKSGISREHSYRGDLETLIRELVKGVEITNEPANVTDCGNPDYVITKGKIPVGYIEAKDIGKDLNHKGYKEQFDRYRKALDNLIITDYLWFRFFQNGELVHEIRIAEIGNKGACPLVQPLADNFAQFENLIQNFCTHIGQTIKSSQKLAEMMASKARLLQNILERAITADEETQENTSLKAQYETFKQILIHDLTPQSFADIYAQTLAYGMFAARLHDKTLHDFSRQEAAELIPKSNPFLRKLFGYVAGPDIDERIVRTVDNLANVFLHTNIEELLKNFGKSTQTHDPIIHFYETFLSEYDPKLRKSRGVWYTPEPVVNFIVRAVDDILKTEFDLPQGLADTTKVETRHGASHKVQILDPATGTGTFLAEVVKYIYNKRFKAMQGAWSGYVEEHLIPRLNGFELLMASYSMAHLKLDMLLAETGYHPSHGGAGGGRFNIYLTNSLEEHHPDTGTLFSTWLSTEANEANRIKRDTPVMCVIGNPPYSGESANKGEWIMKLMEDYKKEPGGKEKLKERNPKWINDDYVKFLRYGQFYIEKNGSGVLAFINPHGFLDNPTFRGMRWNLLKTYDKIYTIDLHGNSKKKEVCPDGSPDVNVFDIMQGVSINIFVKTGKKKANELGKVFHYDLYGKREEKYNFLWDNNIKSVPYVELPNIPANYYFVPKNFETKKMYDRGFAVNELFSVNNVGVVTSRDNFVIADEKQELIQRIKDFFSVEKTELQNKYSLKENKSWKIDEVKIKAKSFNSDFITNVSYRPFDNKYLYYNNNFIERSRKDVMQHFIKGENVGLVFNKPAQGGANLYTDIFITKNITDQSIFSAIKRSPFIAPVYLYADKNKSVKNLFTTEKEKIELQGQLKFAEKNYKQISDFFRTVVKPYFDKIENPTKSEKSLFEENKSTYEEAAAVVESLKNQIEALTQKEKNNKIEGTEIETPTGKPNLNMEIVAEIAKKLGLEFVPEKNSPDPSKGGEKMGASFGGNRGGKPGYVTATPLNYKLIKEIRDNLKDNPTNAEKTMWEYLRNKKTGYKIRRQHIIDNFITDFVCLSKKVVIEIDGKIHLQQKEYDELRTARLNELGFEVIRFTNEEVFANPELVALKIKKKLDIQTSPDPSKGGAKTSPPLEMQVVSPPLEGSGEVNTPLEKTREVFAPIDILDYIYAVLHSPTYREKYKEFLKIDFPRVPYPKDAETFWQLVKLGGEIRQIHLLEEAAIEKSKDAWPCVSTYPIDGDNTITTKITKKDWEIVETHGHASQPAGRIWINDTQYFENIPLTAWEFYIGGYQPAQKWLKDRAPKKGQEGRTLNFDDILHYQKIIVALSETDRLMKEIDKIEIE